MLKVVHTWESISQNKKIELTDVTSLIISNIGDVPFSICGKIYVAGMRYEAPIYGNVAQFKEELIFENVAGNKNAVLEYTFRKKTDLEIELCKG